MAINTTLSNLYVERASSEHPIALWMLNEEVDYISQITNSHRDFWNSNNWSIANGTVTDSLNVAGSPRTPIPESSISKIVGSVPSTSTQDINLISKFEISQETLNQELSNIALGFYVYFDTPLANSISFGYKYVDSILNEQENLYTVLVKNTDRLNWKFFSHTFELPPTNATNIKLVIKINVNGGGTSSEYNLFISGLSLGQWSEDFHKYSYGINPESLPSNINLPEEAELKALPAFSYGTSGNQGYYLSRENTLSCKNFGIPLVYGSSNVTKISPNAHNGVTYPSLIFPGYGFLNERGRHNDYTVEMWIKANVSSTVPLRIFGPISSTDGLYVDNAHLSFKLNDQVASHYVGEWFRPMMIHIRVLTNFLMVLVNGEEVISLEFNQDLIPLPEEVVDEKNQDWIGFYAYQSVDPIDIDTLSIYPYAIPTEVAKRHWVWGQAVVAPEQTNSSINAITAFNDYAFANYSVNYNYPDFANWKQAFFSNVEAGSKILSLPEYQLPEFSLGAKTRDSLYNDISLITPNSQDADDVAGFKYLTLKPNNTWSSNSDFVYFDKLAILNDSVETVYGIFKTDGTEVNAPLFKITNKFNNDYLLVSISGTTVTYKISLSEVVTTLATKTVESGKKFAAGINIEKLSSSQTIDVARFFSDGSTLDVFLAGDGSKKFSGKIYKFGFDGPYNSRKIFTGSDQNGIMLSSNTESNALFLHTANYTLVAISEYGLFFPDIAVAGYWEDYMPLSYFSKAITDYDGTEKYELDSIQFNLDLPEPPTSQTVEVESGWTYADLKSQYTEPELLPYEILDNAYYSGWENYEDMSGNTTITKFYNTSKNIVKSYVSFQKISEGANKNLIDLNTPYGALSSGVLDPENVNAVNWKNTPYEVTTGTVIYPPKRTYAGSSINFNDYAIVYHLDFVSKGILHHPVKLRELQLASKVLERTDFTSVGSKFGIPAYYYSKSGLYFDLKAKNPIATYKKSTPHLYLNRQSGWSIKGNFDPSVDRGLSILINQPKAENTLIGSVQMWVRFYEKSFPSGPIMIFSISHKNGIYDFFLESDSSQQRGFIFGADRESSEILDGLSYCINGQDVNTPTLINEEWAVLSVEFPTLLDFSGVSGKIDINGPLMYNNISYTLATNIEKSESLETRPWSSIEDLGSWEYVRATWKQPAVATWQDVRVIRQSQVYNINSQANYESYTGSNRIVVDDESAGLLISPEQFVAYKEVAWANSVKIPA